MTTTDDRFRAVPDGWKAATDDQLSRGLDTALAVLHGSRVVDDVALHYDRSSNYAGATFLDLDPVDPYAITSGDLLSLTLLGVQAEPQAVRRLLELTTTNREIRVLLTEEHLPLDADLVVADDDTLLAMASLHESLKRALSLDATQTKNPWVTASKLSARKRPDLFPVRDSVVCEVLGLSGPRQNYQVDWQVYRHIIQNDGVRKRLDDIIDEVQQRADVNVGHVNRRLRHLDVALWMHGRRS
ncbi:DUF6308 family protein [Arthrobacter sp. NEB 688]|uniref:DUF6308 family protein n=1 Tax=Arthrobacter sp. NEB 688 TaxID=904039 RepID=UPI001563E9B7|nr:DUF6308 family protein [Arthrobacter sp. NEB 688]QKE84403.1 hypothetical protein HL663_10960 [Arthrobacter sp. NEB 688]